MKRTTGPQNKICIEHILSPNWEDHKTTQKYLHVSILNLKMERTTGPQNKICTWACFISKWRGPQDHKKIFALELIISPNGEDHRTTKQDLHWSIFYLQMKRTTGPQNKIFTWVYYISKWRGPQDHKKRFSLTKREVQSMEYKWQKPSLIGKLDFVVVCPWLKRLLGNVGSSPFWDILSSSASYV
jgi:hypothetical protein